MLLALLCYYMFSHCHCSHLCLCVKLSTDVLEVQVPSTLLDLLG